MRFLVMTLGIIGSIGGVAAEQDTHQQSVSSCEISAEAGQKLVVCRFDPARHLIKLFLRNADDQYFHQFNGLRNDLAQKDEILRFAMNAGMYHADRSPVGLFIEDGRTLKNANMNDGPGNFHLKPNGVFFIDKKGRAGVQETGAFLKSKRKVRMATQSGPMLVINGKIHHRFIPDSPSWKRRNGVGVTRDGQVIFVLADKPLNFDSFARVFRDKLKTPNALYFDGTISRIYAPDLGRNDPGYAMGPIIGVVEKDAVQKPVPKADD